jgi:acyl-CoA dehydrogenase
MSILREQLGLSTDDFPFFFDVGHMQLGERAKRFALEIAKPEEDSHGAGPTPTYDELGARCRLIAQALAKAKLLDVCVPATCGGAFFGGRRDAVDVRAVSLVRETLAWSSALAEFVLAMQGLGTYPIALAGTDNQKKSILPAVLQGESLAAFAITEPEAGTDIASMRCTAERHGDGYVLRGRKTFISNAGIAGHYVVFAKTDPAAGNKGITAFIVKPTDPGFVFEGGLSLVTDHPVGSIMFDDLRVGLERRLAREGDGFKLAISTLDSFRTTVGAAACGMARRALDEALFRATTRRQFGKEIAENQQIQAYLAEMVTMLEASRLLVYRAAAARDHGTERVSIDASMAKMFATESAQKIIDLAVQIHGAVGVLRGTAVERLYRDVRALRIYEGTTEIHRAIIARVLLGGEKARQELVRASNSTTSTTQRTEHITVAMHAQLPPPEKPTKPARKSAPNLGAAAGQASADKTQPEPGAKRPNVRRETMPDTPASKLLAGIADLVPHKKDDK